MKAAARSKADSNLDVITLGNLPSFHIKMFEVSDSKTGYVVGFDVYTGKNKTDCYKTAKTLDPKMYPYN